MTLTQPYTGLKQPDVAYLLDSSDNEWRCYVYVNDQPSSDNTLDFSLYRELPDGETLIERGRVRTPVTNALVDCPRIIATRDSFIAFWIEYDENGRALHRAYLDTTTLHTSLWVYDGSVSLDSEGLYDVVEYQQDADHVVARKTAPGTVEVVQYNDVSWSDVTWTQALAIGIQNCLGVHTNGTDVVIGYQDSATLQCRATRMNWSDGLGVATSQIFTSLGDFYAIGLCDSEDVGAGTLRMAVVAEYVPELRIGTGAGQRARALIYREINPATVATLNQEHQVDNLTLHSKPWPSPTGSSRTTPSREIYCMAGYMNVDDVTTWEQSKYFVVCLDKESWLTETDPNTVRPYPCGNMSTRLANSAPKGIGLGTSFEAPGTRVNHLSHASGPTQAGPLVKSRTIAGSFWARIRGADAAGAEVQGVRWLAEDPWLYYRDAQAPAQGSDNFRFPYPEAAGRSAESPGGVTISGGTPSYYDGEHVVESGFCWYPEIFDVTYSAIGNLPGGVYTYTVTYEWRDGAGRLHRSAPATPVIGTAPAQGSFEIDIRTLNLSLKDSQVHYPEDNPIVIRIWRTESSGTTFRNIYAGATGFAPEDSPRNDPTTWMIQVTDDVTDALLGEALPYTLASGLWTPLEPIQPPRATDVVMWQNRIWLASGRELWYSLEIIPTAGTGELAPEFNPVNVLRLEEQDIITALVVMDDQLIVLSEDKITSVTGIPNDDTGANGSFRQELVTTGTGCIDPRSAIYMPDGVMFQSDKGYYLMGRGRDLNYLLAGAPVEDIVRDGGNIHGAELLRDRHQIRLAVNGTTGGNPPYVLTYDYLMKKWSRGVLERFGEDQISSRLQSSTTWNIYQTGEVAHVVLAQSGLQVEKSAEATAPYADQDESQTDVAIPVDVQTGWLKLGGIAGYQRLRRAGFQLEKPNASEVSVDLEYDFVGDFPDNNFPQTLQWVSPAPEYLDVRPDIQKCAAVRMRIYESGTVPLDENVVVFSVTIDVGVKPGLRRVPATQAGA